jgi:Trypsin-co-occurring domain 1
MNNAIVPATAVFEGQPVEIQVQVNEAAISAWEEEDPERDVSIFRQRKAEPLALDDVGRSIGAIANAVTGAVVKVAPQEAEIEFGVDIGVETGQLTSLLVKGTANATLKVRLLWKNDKAAGSAATAPAEE